MVHPECDTAAVVMPSSDLDEVAALPIECVSWSPEGSGRCPTTAGCLIEL